MEPTQPPPQPRHIVAQQLLALALQEGKIGDQMWPDWWNGLEPFKDAQPILDFLVSEGFLERDGGMLFVGAKAEQRFGRQHFRDLVAVFTAPPEFTVLHKNAEIGRMDPGLLTAPSAGPRLLLLAGRTWQVDWVDWKRRRCFVDPVEGLGGEARWSSSAFGGTSFHLARAMRDVVLGADPPVRLTKRARRGLEEVRGEYADLVHTAGTVVVEEGGDLRWWTWAGHRANATLRATLGPLSDPAQRTDALSLRLRNDLDAQNWRRAVHRLSVCLPEIDQKALNGLKFSAALPVDLALDTLQSRMADVISAAHVLREPARFLMR